MRKFFLFLVLLLSLATFAQAQTTTTVNGSVVDLAGQPFVSGTYTITFSANNIQPPFYQNGTLFTPPAPSTGVLNGSGAFSGVVLPSNGVITPVGTAYIFKFCSLATSFCYTLIQPVAGTTQTINAIAPPITVAANSVNQLTAYQDSEIKGPVEGTLYWNYTSDILRVFHNNVWQNAGGGGGGGSVSIDGVVVSNPNFQSNGAIQFSVSGSNIQLQTGQGMSGAVPLIENGNFELPSFVTTGPIPPQGWVGLGCDTGTMSYDTVNPAPNKTFSLKIQWNANCPESLLPNNNFTTIIPGQSYTATASVRSNGTVPAAICLVFEQGGGSVVNDTANCANSLSTSWVSISVTGTAQSGQDYLIVDIADENQTNSVINGNVAGSAWYDNIQVFPNTQVGFTDVAEIASPGNPATGFERWFPNISTHLFSCLNSTGGSCAPTGGGGSGTVTTFSASNLSPLFTTNVTNPTTTPSLAFTLTNAPAGTVFGNPGASAAVPVYTVAPQLGAVGGGTGSIGLCGNTSGCETITGQPATGGEGFLLSAPGGVGAQIGLVEGSTPALTSGHDDCAADSTLHGIKCAYNGNAYLPLPLLSGAVSGGHFACILGANLLNDCGTSFIIGAPNGGTGVASPTAHSDPEAEGAAPYNYVLAGAALTGQVKAAVNGADPGYLSPGVSGRTVAGATDTILCDSATAIRDRGGINIYTDASGATVTIPDAGSSGCSANFFFGVIAGPSAGAIVFNRTSASTFTVVNGATATSGLTTFTLSAGQYGSIYSPDNANWIVRLVNGSGGGGSVTTTGSPATGNLTKFSGSTSITNGDLGGDCTTAGTLTVTCTRINGVAVPASAVPLATNASAQPVAAPVQGNGAKVQLSTGTVTTNTVTKFDANGNTINSSLVDNGTVITTPEPLSLGTSPPACGGSTPAGPGCFTEGTAPTAVAGVDDLHADSTQKALEVNNNNTGEMPVERSTCVNVTPVTVSASVTTDQNLMTCTLSANLLNVVGRTLHIHAAGIYSTAATSTAQLTAKAKLCTVSGCGSGTVISLVSIQTVALGSVTVTNNNWNLDFYTVTQTAGATAAFESHGQFVIDLGSLTTAADSTFADTNTTTISSIDTTAQLFLQITYTFSAASASNSASQRQGVVEVLN